ncbi:MAG: lamin tail domain-containing protein [Candidatus Moranbacteria bacterium]|nr:lamin tail domain-containing protein [Candidatus Moranbacteria bacterium]
MTKRFNSKISNSLVRIGLVGFFFVILSGFSKIQGTNSFFSDTASVDGISFSSGYWVPTLEYSVKKPSPDGNNGFYVSRPCVTLKAKLGGEDAPLSDVDIYYSLDGANDPGDSDQLYDGTCVPIPDGNPVNFKAVAMNNLNHDWKSDVAGESFKVDTVCPAVKINDPDVGSKLSGKVDIVGTVADANPDHYWLVVEDSSGHEIAGPGTVSEDASFDHKNLFEWDTTKVDDGGYTIKLEARDAAGNKCPNEAPVSSDPNVDGDSVDWINVDVKNTPDEPEVEAGDVVINEVMWMGSQKDSGTAYSADEWIELRNTTGHDINIKNWNLYGIKKGGHYEFAGGSDVIIPGHGFLLISDKGKNDSRIDVTPDFTNNNLDFENDYSEHGKIVLKDKDNNKIDETPEPSGSDWPAGKNEKHMRWSMERNDDPGSGWHTCDPTAMSSSQLSDMHSYWDIDAQLYNCGTPGHANLSENDPSSKKDENNSGSGDGSDKVSEKIPIEVVGKLDVTDGLKYKLKRKIKRVDLVGDVDEKEIIIDLSKLGEISKKGEIKIKIKDLELPYGVKVKNHKDKNLVLLITVEKDKKKPSNQKKEKLKKEEETILPKNDAGKNEEDGEVDSSGGDGSGGGDGDATNDNEK